MTGRRSLAIALIAFALLPAGAWAQGFEGVLKQKLTTVMPQGVATLAGADTAGREKVLAAVGAKLDAADPSLVQIQDMTSYVKGTKLRIEGAGGFGPGGYAILDAATDSMFVVVPAMSRVLVATIGEMGEIQKQNATRAGIDVATLAANLAVSDFGESTVAGVKVHGWRIANDAMLAVHWFDPSVKDPDMPAIESMMRRMSGGLNSDSATQALLKGKGHSVRVLSIMKAPPIMGAGWMVTRIESAPLEKRAVEDAMFTLPADLQRTRLADIMPH